jgi:hypothetical protein
MGYTHGTKWTDDCIRDGIMEIVKFNHIERMPTRREVEEYFGNCALSNAISRRKGGWYGLAQELGLPVKENETYFGKTNEQAVMEELVSMGYEVRKMPQNFPYDLLVNECVKIDVKASRLYKGSAGDFYSFNLEKPYCTCDIYVLRLMLDTDQVLSSLIVPSAVVSTHTQISVGQTKSKYHKYKGRWDYIERYAQFMYSVGREALVC